MLTDMTVRQAKATGKPYTIADFDGLSLFVSANGARTWHFRYTWVGQRARISLGSYPELSLREARELRDEARSLVARGINPRTDRKQKRQAIRLAGENTFMAVYEKWMEHRQLTLEEGRQSSLEQIRRVFKKDVFPYLKRLTIYEVTRPHLLEVIGRIEKRDSLSVAEKVRTWLKQLFDYAMVVIPAMETNPATDLHVVAVPLPPVDHNPFLRMAELPEFLQTAAQVPRHAEDATGDPPAAPDRGPHGRAAAGHARSVRSGPQAVDHPGHVAQAAQDAHPQEAQAPHRHPAVHRPAVRPGDGDRPPHARRLQTCAEIPVRRRQAHQRPHEREHPQRCPQAHGLRGPADRPRHPRHDLDGPQRTGLSESLGGRPALARRPQPYQRHL
jgi:hypothetical protein